MLCMYVHVQSTVHVCSWLWSLLPLVSVSPPLTHACIPVHVLFTYSSIPLIVYCSLLSSSAAVRDENKDEDSDDDNKENEVPQWHLPYMHTYMY